MSPSLSSAYPPLPCKMPTSDLPLPASAAPSQGAQVGEARGGRGKLFGGGGPSIALCGLTYSVVGGGRGAAQFTYAGTLRFRK